MKKSLISALGVAAFATILGASIYSTPALAWGDNAGGRDSYTIEDINAGALDNVIIFNTIENSTIGDEKNFVGAREDTGENKGAENIWDGNEITVEDGKTYLIRIYAHNNNPFGEKMVAENVTTTFSLPTNSDSSLEINGFIKSSNATPSEYWDNVVLKSKNGEKFHINYVAGSALLENNGIGKDGGVALSDDIISSGVMIGYSALDGRVPGCYQYANYVGIKVKVTYDYDFTIEKQVRLVGDSEWKESVDAKPGDKVEFQIIYKNTSSATENDVMLRDSLPENLVYVPGTTKVYNAAYKTGLLYEDTLGTTGINLGSYTAGSNAIVRFTAEVASEDSLQCGGNIMQNIAQIFVSGTEKSDDASVVTSKFCSDPKPVPTPDPDPIIIPKTGASDVISGVIGAGSIVTAAGYYISSKKRF